MAAQVSSLARMLSGCVKEDGDGGNREPVTRDFLGGVPVLGSPDVDLELKVPDGWVRRLDLTSGKTYILRRDPEIRSIQDLNLTPPSARYPRPAAAAAAGTTSPFPDPSTNLDLQLSASAPRTVAAAAVPEYSSICTLEKVKFALERAERESRATIAIRPSQPLQQQQPPLFFLPPRPEGRLVLSPTISSTTTTTTTSSMKRRASELAAQAAAEVGEGSESSVGAGAGAGEGEEKMAVAACPGCLLYVLVSKEEPRCPRCAAHVPIKPRHHQMKKPKLSLDLNSSLQIDDDE